MRFTGTLQRYRIRVGCHLAPARAACFDRVAVTNLPNGQAVLDSDPIDQSGLLGLLARLGSLNIRLISVAERVRDEPIRATVPAERPD